MPTVRKRTSRRGLAAIIILEMRRERLVQVVCSPDYKGSGRGFESRKRKMWVWLAQAFVLETLSGI